MKTRVNFTLHAFGLYYDTVGRYLLHMLHRLIYSYVCDNCFVWNLTSYLHGTPQGPRIWRPVPGRTSHHQTSASTISRLLVHRALYRRRSQKLQSSDRLRILGRRRQIWWEKERDIRFITSALTPLTCPFRSQDYFLLIHIPFFSLFSWNGRFFCHHTKKSWYPQKKQHFEKKVSQVPGTFRKSR